MSYGGNIMNSLKRNSAALLENLEHLDFRYRIVKGFGQPMPGSLEGIPAATLSDLRRLRDALTHILG
jgi:hypothetical protein